MGAGEFEGVHVAAVRGTADQGDDAMPLPRVREARSFYQSAFQRFEDAKFLMDGERTTGAVYLAGYGVECILKALILSALKTGSRPGMLNEFRGSRAHDFSWLRRQYFENGGPPLPKKIAKLFSLVSTWTTTLRYMAGTMPYSDAAAFMNSATEILGWADGRL
jgi:hypothetical protein